MLLASLCCVQVSAQSKYKYRYKGRNISSKGLGVELVMSSTNCEIDLPGLLKDEFSDVKGGKGYNVGLGLTFDNGNNLNLRNGIHVWGLPFIPTIIGESNNESIVEDGKITYHGIYTRIEWGNSFFFIGGGFDIAMVNTYKADRIFYRNDREIGRENNVNRSILTKMFVNQFSINLNAGFKIPVGDYAIKPFVSIGSVPGSIYPARKVSTISNGPGFTVKYNTPQTVDLQYIYIVRYGIALEYKLKE